MLIRSIRSLFSTDRDLSKNIKLITGKFPGKIELYKLAVRHASVAKSRNKNLDSNERLEFLGDAVLGTIVADYLFKKYPYKSEGFLTEIRSRIVNRESLNNLARKIGLDNLILVNSSKKKSAHSHKSLHGNALEALIGAIYIDHGFSSCQDFIIKKLLIPHMDLEEIVENNNNYKSMLIEWSQKCNKDIRFEIIKEIGNNHNKQFTAQVYLDNEAYGLGVGFSKKKAEQAAAEKTCDELQITA